MAFQFRCQGSDQGGGPKEGRWRRRCTGTLLGWNHVYGLPRADPWIGYQKQQFTLRKSNLSGLVRIFRKFQFWKNCNKTKRVLVSHSKRLFFEIALSWAYPGAIPRVMDLRVGGGRPGPPGIPRRGGCGSGRMGGWGGGGWGGLVTGRKG